VVSDVSGVSVTHARGSLLAVATLLVIGLCGACGYEDGSEEERQNPPGATADVGAVSIQFAHVAEPRDEPWQEGDDVPAYLRVLNEGRQPDALVGAETPVADSVTIVGADGQELPGGVPLPPHEPRELYEGKSHLVLNDIHERLRGGDYLDLTLRFDRAGSVTLQVHVQAPAYDRPTGNALQLTAPSSASRLAP
jgi:copper(I)-binding protein